ncbi:MAG: hypothetical protein M2R45_01574 [Verrucomicrobia subdivision 3 bacterium]|nr:hypothetical protein [Limisphaerales bacterium]MCS1413300.1 hypothetical protein [Limisphaerales bacterium]
MRRIATLALFFGTTPFSEADVKVPSLFGDHMVLQREQPNAIWGWADEDEVVTVNISSQRHTTRTKSNGRWKITLDPLPSGGPYTLEIKGKNTLNFENILVGEVWVCSGQSNMQWAVNSSNDPDLEKLAAHYPQIRHITLPRIGTQEPQYDFEGQWELCSPKSIGDFSAVGYYFGRQLHQTLQVPIGLIDNAWGGSSAEAWVRRDLLESDDRYQSLMKQWEETERTYNHAAATAQYQEALKKWGEATAEARAAGKKVNRARPRAPRNPLVNQHRPANLYNGVLKPIIGYGIRGVIWYQGESNASRAYQYRELFPLMIQNWRDEWKQGDFPFYWVQLADFRDEKSEPGDSDWAELREAQTLTLDRLPNTGQVVITDLGEAHDIHPKNKQDVAKRLARVALARDYGLDLVHQSPRYASMQREGNKIILEFAHVGGGLDTFDVRYPLGFTIAGDKRQFVHASAKILSPNQIEVWSDEVEEPIAVRYAWADNPICNVQNREGLPLTPFRTDDWPGLTIDNH